MFAAPKDPFSPAPTHTSHLQVSGGETGTQVQVQVAFSAQFRVHSSNLSTSFLRLLMTLYSVSYLLAIGKVELLGSLLLQLSFCQKMLRHWDRNVELLKTERRESPSAPSDRDRDLSQTGSRSAYDIPEDCLVCPSGMLQESSGCLSAASFPCSWGANARRESSLHGRHWCLLPFHQGSEEQTVSSLQRILKCLQNVALALLSHCLFCSGHPQSFDKRPAEQLSQVPLRGGGMLSRHEGELLRDAARGGAFGPSSVLSVRAYGYRRCRGKLWPFKIPFSVLNQQPLHH